MCTVTFLPLSANHFILTSNRDEALARKPSLAPAKYTVEAIETYFPKDQEANGTWMVTSENKFTLCLLNGAFEKHQHQPPYKKSRGIVVLDFFKFNHVDMYCSNYSFTGIEPFTLIIVDANDQVSLYELRWDGVQLHKKMLDATVPCIWSSVTLYSKPVIETRERWFKQWLKQNKTYTQEAIFSFHHFGGEGDLQNDLIMDRDDKKTLSITSVAYERFKHAIIYKDLINDKLYNLLIK